MKILLIFLVVVAIYAVVANAKFKFPEVNETKVLP
ncbi:GSCOCT00014078001.2-RA-CDS [Cotesia congregata]|uniref:80-5b n=1 Tax=Cotesia congregata TaxID=51543 RepID=A0A8J2HJA1_COTCN|nr:GSCOCT00014078001.2-RA-CDS [Cotesia congregata]CAG5100337.1 80-5b [Cotesia congregata]